MKTASLESATVTALPKDIVEYAYASSDFTTLSNALRAADLARIFKGPGPFTFFAPTDDAFMKIAPEVLEALLNDKVRLRAVLNHHVLRGTLKALDLSHCSAKTLHGSTIKIGATDDGLTVDNANVTQVNIHVSNGVIHAIDTVLLEIGEAIAQDPNEAVSPWAGKNWVPKSRSA